MGSTGSLPTWFVESENLKDRLFSFYRKMEDKMVEFCNAAIPELTLLSKDDKDIYRRDYYKFLSGVNGQLDSIRRKGNEVYEGNIEDFYCRHEHSISVLDPHYDLLLKFVNTCREERNRFESVLDCWADRLKVTSVVDYEEKYQAILADYEASKDKFSCAQCGGAIVIEKIFFIDTYITCPYCQTSNTFSPSSQARHLQDIAHDLAEQRAATLLQAYENELKHQDELYSQAHELELSLIHEKSMVTITEKNNLLAKLKQLRAESIKRAPELKKKYVMEKFTEWKKITPDLADHLDRRMQNELELIR